MDYNKLEKQEARKIGADVHKNSGRGKIQKGDASNELFVIDFKFVNKSFTVSKEVWAKICTDAVKTDPNKAPMLYVVIDGSTRLAVIEYSMLEELMENYDSD